MQPRQFELKFDDLMTSDGVPLGFDSKILLQVDDSVGLIKNFGPNWYENNIEAEFSNRVRQAVRKHGMNETAISTTAIDAIDAEVTGAMQSYIANAHLPVHLIRVIIGKANPQDSIKNQRVETAAQEQRQQTEVQRTLAENARKNAETARAIADNAYRQSLGNYILDGPRRNLYSLLHGKHKDTSRRNLALQRI
jgi:regulator of protease activity HflC (stomatin/prohibitin superfamily)